MLRMLVSEVMGYINTAYNTNVYPFTSRECKVICVLTQILTWSNLTFKTTVTLSCWKLPVEVQRGCCGVGLKEYNIWVLEYSLSVSMTYRHILGRACRRSTWEGRYCGPSPRTSLWWSDPSPFATSGLGLEPAQQNSLYYSYDQLSYGSTCTCWSIQQFIECKLHVAVYALLLSTIQTLHHRLSQKITDVEN